MSVIVCDCYSLRLAAAQAELATVMEALKAKQAQLAEVENQIAALQKTYDDSVAEKTRLEKSIAQTGARLKRASKLTTALGDEQIRWDQTVKVCVIMNQKNCVTVRRQLLTHIFSLSWTIEARFSKGIIFRQWLDYFTGFDV